MTAPRTTVITYRGVTEEVQIRCNKEKRDINFTVVNNPRRAKTTVAKARVKLLRLSRNEGSRKYSATRNIGAMAAVVGNPGF